MNPAPPVPVYPLSTNETTYRARKLQVQVDITITTASTRIELRNSRTTWIDSYRERKSEIPNIKGKGGVGTPATNTLPSFDGARVIVNFCTGHTCV